MDQQLKDRALNLYRRDHPTGSEPTKIEAIECYSKNWKGQAIVLSDELGLLATFRIGHKGRLEAAVPYPEKSVIPGSQGRLRPRLHGLPEMPSNEVAKYLIVDPIRVRACAKSVSALDDLLGEGISFYGRQADLCLQEQAKVDAEFRKLASNPAKNRARIRKAGLEREAIKRCLEHAKKKRADLQSAQEQLRRESGVLEARALLLENPGILDEIEAWVGVEKRAWLEHQIGIDVLREVVQNMGDPEGEPPDQLVADHDAVATATTTSFPLVRLSTADLS